MPRAKSTVIVAAVALLAIGGLLTAAVVLDDGSASSGADDPEQPSEQGDNTTSDDEITDTEPVDEESGDGDNNESDDNLTPPDDGSENDGNATDESDDGSDESATGDDDPADSDGETNSTEQDGEGDGSSLSEHVAVTVSLELADLGHPDTGEMYLREHRGDEALRTHNLSEEGHNRTFEDLERDQLYDVVVITPYFPPEEFVINPTARDVVDRTVGYEFSSADNYRIRWRVGYLPQYFEGDHTSERAEEEAIPLYGESRHDAQGNYYSEWSDPKIRGKTQYYYNASANQTFRSMERRDWGPIPAYWGDIDTPRDMAIREGLSGVEERRFLRVEKSANQEVHVYEVPASVFGNPAYITVDPETGYPVEFTGAVEKMSNADATYEEVTYHDLGEEINVMPSDFPEEEFDLFG